MINLLLDLVIKEKNMFEVKFYILRIIFKHSQIYKEYNN